MDEERSIDLAPEEAPSPAGEEEDLRRQVQEDAARFMAAYPETDMGALEGDPEFRRFCGSRLYREPLAELYGDFIALSGEAERRSASRRADKSRRSTGSGAGDSGGGLTGEQKTQLEEWNRAYPQMRMTAREFLNR